MLYMLIGHFREGVRGAALPPARGAPDAPSGLRYIGSWVEATLGRCFQVVECDDTAALQRWAARWRHRVTLELVPIVPATDAVTALEPLLE
jgi:hypothetical protein